VGFRTNNDYLVALRSEVVVDNDDDDNGEEQRVKKKIRAYLKKE